MSMYMYMYLYMNIYCIRSQPEIHRSTLINCSGLATQEHTGKLLWAQSQGATDLRPGDVDDASSLLLQQVGDEAVLQRVGLHLNVAGIATARQGQQQTVLSVVLWGGVSREPGVSICTCMCITCSTRGQNG